MLSLDEAIERLLGQVVPLPAERAESVSTFDALGRVLAEDVRSLLDVPPADNTRSQAAPKAGLAEMPE